jgi:hypothetical protein
MAAEQPEIIRRLNDRVVVAWDTTDVSDSVRKRFDGAVSHQADLLVKVLREDGTETVHVVELKSAGASRKGRKAAKAAKAAGTRKTARAAGKLSSRRGAQGRTSRA